MPKYIHYDEKDAKRNKGIVFEGVPESVDGELVLVNYAMQAYLGKEIGWDTTTLLGSKEAAVKEATEYTRDFRLHTRVVEVRS